MAPRNKKQVVEETLVVDQYETEQSGQEFNLMDIELQSPARLQRFAGHKLWDEGCCVSCTAPRAGIFFAHITTTPASKDEVWTRSANVDESLLFDVVFFVFDMRTGYKKNIAADEISPQFIDLPLEISKKYDAGLKMYMGLTFKEKQEAYLCWEDRTKTLQSVGVAHDLTGRPLGKDARTGREIRLGVREFEMRVQARVDMLKDDKPRFM